MGLESIAMEQLNNDTAFPIEVFPRKIQDYILKANQTLNHPVDYLGASVLFTTAMAMGNSVRLKVKNGWNEVAILYIAIVGKPGINKTHSLNFGIQPLFKMERHYYNQYKQDLIVYQKLDEKERLRTPEPDLKQLLITDITPETISQVHEINLRGIGYYKDELIAWLNDFNRYHKGSDEQFWLSAFSNKSIRVNRANKKTIMIESPFIPVIGGIQPSILPELFGDKRTGNGFTDRILFVFPDQIEKPHWKEEEMPQELIEEYDNMINHLFKIELRFGEYHNIQPYEVGFSLEAKAHFIKWYNSNTDEYNHPSTPSHLAGSISKSDVICCRLMLILQALQDAAITQPVQQIELSTVINAIRLTEYFKIQAKKAKQYIKENELRLSHNERWNYLQNLPQEFTKDTSRAIATDMSIHIKTAEKHLEHFVKNGFVSRLRHGQYKKN